MCVSRPISYFNYVLDVNNFISQKTVLNANTNNNIGSILPYKWA